MYRLPRGLSLVALVCLSAVASAQAPTLGPVRTDRRVGPAISIEGTVDPSTYTLGPGDVLAATLGGQSPRVLEAQVSADGLLVIPEAGTFQASGRTLADVQRAVRAALDRQYRNVPTDLVLTAPRRYFVHVSGAVAAPGRRLVGPVPRLEDALAAAGGLAEVGGLQPAARAVVVRREGGADLTVDYRRYLATGDLDGNPRLLDGDVVYLPTFDPLSEGALVGGVVARPGPYDLKPGDTVRDLVLIAGGPEASVTGVRLTRAAADGAIADRLLAPGELGTVAVQPGDQLYVLARDEDAGTAEALGLVRYPGVYPIRDGETTVRELVRRAGGVLPEALPRAAVLYRQPEAAGTQSLAPDATRLSEFDVLRRAYLQQEASRPAQVSIDLAAALRGEGESVVVRTGDRLVVPSGAGTVYVFGQVLRPGLVPFAAGQTAGAYVAAAGGAASGAETTFVIEAGTGRYVEGPATPVGPGDRVFVERAPRADTPELRQLELALESDRRNRTLQVIQTAFAAISTVATLIFAYDAITN
ncbi:SLBB domain-containing protein [Rubrivirga sp. S365]|uniref:SLBB domain-containing protein n=1 Tax=Rubrivirga litoralis TaxID=3075598 RepID=A0ABU3BV62_9BACT|nr:MULTISPECIES: SLBB domain-containing protein [unclassified Rubrivirga]MDT0633177.1 SLBB domain-containing protein [Rubrivirga sp. F394]MDT7858008.1 SLBB domain-containing protein [Rubrivirga sp. S365]